MVEEKARRYGEFLVSVEQMFLKDCRPRKLARMNGMVLDDNPMPMLHAMWAVRHVALASSILQIARDTLVEGVNVYPTRSFRGN